MDESSETDVSRTTRGEHVCAMRPLAFFDDVRVVGHHAAVTPSRVRRDVIAPVRCDVGSQRHVDASATERTLPMDRVAYPPDVEDASVSR